MKRTALFTALSLLMTWPLASQLGTIAPEHHDVYFNRHSSFDPVVRLHGVIAATGCGR